MVRWCDGARACGIEWVVLVGWLAGWLVGLL
jgi:hypothetical protein